MGYGSAYASGSEAADLEWSAAVRGGTTGFGAEIAASIQPKFGVRAAWHDGSISRNVTESGVTYEGTWKFGTGLILFDFHPTGGRFRVSVGLGYNDNHLELTARGTSGTIELNGTSYSLSSIGTVHGVAGFQRTSPYLGVGWGSASKSALGTGVFFSADLGVLFTDPRVSLTAECGAGMSAPQCAQFQNDLAAEAQAFKDSFAIHGGYPVLSFGVGYRF